MTKTNYNFRSYFVLRVEISNRYEKNKQLSLSYIISLFSLLLLSFSTHSFASTAQDFILPQQVTELKLTPMGKGTFKKFGFKIFHAKLWVQSNQNQLDTSLNSPYALQLKYARNIKAKRIVDASIKEMRAQKVPKSRLAQWHTELSNIIPSVKKGDVITGVNMSEKSEFYLNGKLIGTVKNSDFGKDFFGIWLKSNTSEPKLRKQLLVTQ